MVVELKKIYQYNMSSDITPFPSQEYFEPSEICNCLLIRIDKNDILSSTGNTLYSNNAVYIDGIYDCDSANITQIITESGYNCYCTIPGPPPILCDMSGYTYDISTNLILGEPLTLYTPPQLDPNISEVAIPNIYYYKDDVLVTEVYSTYYNSTDTCSIDSDCCTDICKIKEYCISNTGNQLYNDVYDESGLHNGKPHWVGTTNGLFIYYSIELNQWCLSSSLDGPCLLSGKSPCPSVCPDLNGAYLSSGMCLTPTPTPTNNCNILDFQSFFNCEIPNTPTPTQTPTHTPTQTMTPSSTNFCPLIGVVATINSLSPTPTPTPTMTPTSSGIITRPCQFYGDATFNTVNEMINCPISKQFQDCFNGTMYYTPNNVKNPSGGNIEQFMVFNALVDGLTKCISYVGTTEQISGVNNIILNSGPYGYSNLNGCSSCVPNPTPTPTMTPTPTSTPIPPIPPILCDLSGFTYGDI